MNPNNISSKEKQAQIAKEQQRERPQCHQCLQNQDSSSKLRKYISCSEKGCSKAFCRDCSLINYHYSHNKFASIQTKNNWMCFSCIGLCDCEKCQLNARAQSNQQHQVQPRINHQNMMLTQLQGSNSDPLDQTSNQAQLNDVSIAVDKVVTTVVGLGASNGKLDSNIQEQKQDAISLRSTSELSEKIRTPSQSKHTFGETMPKFDLLIDKVNKSQRSDGSLGMSQSQKSSRSPSQKEEILEPQTTLNLTDNRRLNQKEDSAANGWEQDIKMAQEGDEKQDEDLQSNKNASNLLPYIKKGSSSVGSKSLNNYPDEDLISSSQENNDNIVVNKVKVLSQEEIKKQDQMVPESISHGEDKIIQANPQYPFSKVQEETKSQNNIQNMKDTSSQQRKFSPADSQYSDISGVNKNELNDDEFSTKKKRRQKTSNLAQLYDNNGLTQEQSENQEQYRRSKRECVKKPDHYYQSWCHHCNKLEVVDNMIQCKNSICGQSFCFQCLQKEYHPTTLKNKQDFINLKKNGMACPVCSAKCKCKNCYRANISDDISKIKKDIEDLTTTISPCTKISVKISQQPAQTKALSKRSESMKDMSGTKIQIPSTAVSKKATQATTLMDLDPKAPYKNNIDISNKETTPSINNQQLKNNEAQIKMFATTKISQVAPVITRELQRNINKFILPCNPYDNLSHEFSEVKYLDVTQPDYRGYPPNVNDEYTEEDFDYEQRKLELTLEQIKNVSHDRVNIKQSLKNLKVFSIQKMATENMMAIDGIEIFEKIEITPQNYKRIPIYQEWKKRMDALAEQPLQQKWNMSSSMFDQTKMKDAQSKKGRVMEIGMSNCLIGTKRTFQNASQQKIIAKQLEENKELEEQLLKRRKLNQEIENPAQPHDLSSQCKVNPISQQDVGEKDSQDIGSLEDFDEEINELDAVTTPLADNKSAISELMAYQKPIFAISAPKNQSQNQIQQSKQWQQSINQSSLVQQETSHEIINKPQSYSQQAQMSEQKVQGSSQPSFVDPSVSKITQEKAVCPTSQQQQHQILSNNNEESILSQQSRRTQANGIQSQQPLRTVASYPGQQQQQAATSIQQQQQQQQQQPSYYYQSSYGNFQQIPQNQLSQMIQTPYQTIYTQQMVPGGVQYTPVVTQQQYQQTAVGQNQVIISGVDGAQMVAGQPCYVQQSPNSNAMYGYVQNPSGAQASAVLPLQTQGALTQAIGNQIAPTAQYQVMTNQGPMYMQAGAPGQFSAYPQVQQIQAQQSGLPMQAAQTASGQTIIYAQAAPSQQSIQPQYQIATTSTGQQVYIIQQPQGMISAAQQQTSHEQSYYQQQPATVQYQGPNGATMYGQVISGLEISQAQAQQYQNQEALDSDILQQIQIRQQDGGQSLQNLIQNNVGQPGTTQMYQMAGAGGKAQSVTLAYFDPSTNLYYPVQTATAGSSQQYQQISSTQNAQQSAALQQQRYLSQQQQQQEYYYPQTQRIEYTGNPQQAYAMIQQQSQQQQQQQTQYAQQQQQQQHQQQLQSLPQQEQQQQQQQQCQHHHSHNHNHNHYTANIRDDTYQHNQNAVCNTCHKNKTTGQAPAFTSPIKQNNRQGAAQNTNNNDAYQEKKNQNETSYAGANSQAPQIIYQPFQVVRGNLYQTQVTAPQVSYITTQDGAALQQQPQGNQQIILQEASNNQQQQQIFSQQSLNQLSGHELINNKGSYIQYVSQDGGIMYGIPQSNEVSLMVGHRGAQVQQQMNRYGDLVSQQSQKNIQSKLTQQTPSKQPIFTINNSKIAAQQQQLPKSSIVIQALTDGNEENNNYQFPGGSQSNNMIQVSGAYTVAATQGCGEQQHQIVENTPQFQQIRSQLLPMSLDGTHTETLNPIDVLMKHGLKDDKTIGVIADQANELHQQNADNNQQSMINIQAIQGQTMAAQDYVVKQNQQQQLQSQQQHSQMSQDSNIATRTYTVQQQDNVGGTGMNYQTLSSTNMQNLTENQILSGFGTVDQVNNASIQVQEAVNQELDFQLASLQRGFNSLYQQQQQQNQNKQRQNQTFVLALGEIEPQNNNNNKNSQNTGQQN